MDAYSQTTEYTCAASSLLMILHQLSGVPLTREQEFAIWQRSVNLPVRASSVYGLAIIAHKHGLQPRVVLEEKEYDYPDYRFKGYTKKEIDEAKFSSRQYAKQAREMGIPIEEREVTFKEIMDELGKNKPILLRLNAGVFRDSKSTSKYVVVFLKEQEIRIMDPRRGEITVDEHMLQDAMVTLQTKKKRDVRMITFDAPDSTLQ